MLDCLEDNRQHVVWWDQYALNVVLAGRWRAVDRRWNQGGQIFGYPGWQQSPLDQESFEQLRNDPWIIHYNSKAKPWRAKCRHPLRQEFVTYLDRTAWAGHAPPLGERLIALLDQQERRLRHGRNGLHGKPVGGCEPDKNDCLSRPIHDAGRRSLATGAVGAGLVKWPADSARPAGGQTARESH